MPSSLSLAAALAALALFAGVVGSSGTAIRNGRGLEGLPCFTLNSCSADITGVVENGANAALVATAPGVSAKTAVANAAGAYVFSSLPPGTYSVGPTEAEAASFEYLPSSVSVTLSGNGETVTATKMVRRLRGPPPPPAWLPQCTKVDVGNRFTLISAPAGSAPISSADLDTELNVDRNTTAARFASGLGIGDPAALAASASAPAAIGVAPSNVTNSSDVTGAAICSGDGYTRYRTGPNQVPTFCKLFTAYGLYGSLPVETIPGVARITSCSGTFIQDPSGQGKLLFLTVRFLPRLLFYFLFCHTTKTTNHFLDRRHPEKKKKKTGRTLRDPGTRCVH